MCGIIKNYKAKVADEELEELPRKECGSKPLLPSKLDGSVLSMIKNMGKASCAINHDIAIAIAKDIVLENDFSLSKENGDSLQLSYT